MPEGLTSGHPSENTNAKEQAAKIAAGIDNNQLGNTPNIVMPGEVVKGTENNHPKGQ